jgi:hypothetical protein
MFAIAVDRDPENELLRSTSDLHPTGTMTHFHQNNNNQGSFPPVHHLIQREQRLWERSSQMVVGQVEILEECQVGNTGRQCASKIQSYKL